MNAPIDIKVIFLHLSRPQVLAEVLAIIIASLLALAAAQFVRNWSKRGVASAAQSKWQARMIEGGVILAPFVFALALLLIVRGTLAFAGTHTGVIDVALQLTTALILVRLGMYLLRLLVGPDSWVKAWEGRLTVGVWLAIAFQLVGWFETAQHTLDSMYLLPGKSTFSLWSLLKGFVVVTAFVMTTTLIARTIERRVMLLHGLALSTRIGISKFSYFLLVGIGIMLGINAAGVDLTALTVLTGAVGLGLGFGLQAIASNFVSGFVLLMDKSIKPGDVISFTGHTGTSTENFGWVQELRGRFVVVRDRDGVDTLVPNQNLITNSVINWSYSDQRVRLRLPAMVSYDDDPEIALQVLIDAASRHPRILTDPGPVSRLMAFEDYGMRLEVRFWIRDPMNGVNNVRSDINREIWRLFRQHGITMPVAQRAIRIIGRRDERRLAARPAADPNAP